ncbi:hypothetical protein SXCC_02591 [Gluconacetobacter sp. SXCC-1]|nr:hypothetical protein SXCC_02591 [Gluconacetobacter sp. SXCC-1]
MRGWRVHGWCENRFVMKNGGSGCRLFLERRRSLMLSEKRLHPKNPYACGFPGRPFRNHK